MPASEDTNTSIAVVFLFLWQFGPFEINFISFGLDSLSSTNFGSCMPLETVKLEVFWLSTSIKIYIVLHIYILE